MPFLGARKHPGNKLGKVEPIGGIEYPTAGAAGPGAATTWGAGPGVTTTGAGCWT